jgi:hypothetical protein
VKTGAAGQPPPDGSLWSAALAARALAAGRKRAGAPSHRRPDVWRIAAVQDLEIVHGSHCDANRHRESSVTTSVSRSSALWHTRPSEAPVHVKNMPPNAAPDVFDYG